MEDEELDKIIRVIRYHDLGDPDLAGFFAKAGLGRSNLAESHAYLLTLGEQGPLTDRLAKSGRGILPPKKKIFF